MKSLQVTIGAGVTRFSTVSIPCRQIIVQNNASNVVRVGDVSTTTLIGASLAASAGAGQPGGSITIGPFRDHHEDLSNWYVAGTQNDVLDVFYT